MVVTQEPVGLPVSGLMPAAVSSTTDSADATEPNHPWQQIVQWMEHDPRTKPAGPVAAARGPVTALLADWIPWGRRDTDGRDPFLPPRSVQRAAMVDPQQDSEPEVPLVPPPISPKNAGVSLTGVVAGPASGAAMINGRTFFLGEEVVVQKSGASYAFRLTEVRPGGVVLEREGVRYELDMPGPAHLPLPRRSAAAPGTPP
jgi:hypothetical protein